MTISGNDAMSEIDRRLAAWSRLAQRFAARIGDLRLELGQLHTPTERRNWPRVCDLKDEDEHQDKD
jgi:hypothetical protein